MNLDKQSRFLDLINRVQACRRCPRMEGSARVLGPGCGPLDATLVFVGEAPGRLGADGSHLPFHGDKSGHNFEALIEQVGISRYEVFVTNAVLCNPKDENGNNATPTQTEISNCASFLQEQLDVVDPQIVVTLGAVALRACSMVEPHAWSLREDVRTCKEWFHRKLAPVYHPGQRAMVHRSFANQLADYQFIAETARRLKRPTSSRGRGTEQRPGSKKVGQAARRLLENAPKGLSYFALHKLYFLAEVAHMEAAGERISNAYVVRQKDGPYFVDLHLAKLPRLIEGLQVEKRGVGALLAVRQQRSLDEEDCYGELTHQECNTLDHVMERYGQLSEAELKRIVYLSSPMRAILRKERSLRINLFNAAVLPYRMRA